MERVSSKHGRHLDEEMAKETLGLTQASGVGGRTEEWVPEGQHGLPEGGETDADRREWRAKIGSFVHKDVFPAGPDALVSAAQAQNAPDDVISALEGLPEQGEYANARELWGALGLRIDERF
jgi:hypothetical protein